MNRRPLPLVFTMALIAACSSEPNGTAPAHGAKLATGGTPGEYANGGGALPGQSESSGGIAKSGALSGEGEASLSTDKQREPAAQGGRSSGSGQGGAGQGGEATAGAESEAGVSSLQQGGATGDPGAMRPFACGPSKAPMFHSQEPLKLRISADFTKLNGAASAEESGSSGTIEVGGEAAALTANVVARGNSRFRFCQVRPFSLKFSEKQKGNVFEHLGKSVKFVSHCVAKPDAPPNAQAASMADYEQRVLMEHAMYQALDTLGMPSLKTRLVHLTYHDTQTDQEETHPAFVLEPEDEMAERCGMVKAEDLEPGVAEKLPWSPYGIMLLQLLNNFILQYDWDFTKNVIPLVDVDGQQVFYGIYDFDLTAVMRPDYSKNQQRTLEQNAAALADWLRINQTPALFQETRAILRQAEAMRRAFQLPGLAEQSRALFSSWLSHFLPVLQAFADCEGHSAEAEFPACHIQDDHSSWLASATPMTLGEWTTRIEPPGDRDVFSVELEADRLYSTGGGLQVELLDDRGSQAMHLESIDPVTFRAAYSGTFYVRASKGDNWIVSRLHDPASELNASVFLYADDAGSSLDTATTLRPGATFEGKWELSTGWDQDWFLVQASASSSLHVSLARAHDGSPAIAVVRLDAASEEQSMALQFGDNDASSLFGEPGEYVVKLIHNGFNGPSGYRIDLN